MLYLLLIIDMERGIKAKPKLFALLTSLSEVIRQFVQSIATCNKTSLSPRQKDEAVIRKGLEMGV